ncbi:MAG: hypothetical protein IKR11_06000 [Solobacterium sp.]|nr:hypothetical protein [Solobacterium sp.]
MKNWAYKFAENAEPLNIKDIYYAAKYFDREGLVNPASSEAYTDAEITAIKNNAKEGNDSYCFDVKEGALLGLSACNTGKVFWYDEETGGKIVKSPAPFILDGETGDLKTMEGNTVVASAMK